MAGSNQSSVAYLFKVVYAGDLSRLTKRRHTLLAKLTKTGGFTGKNFTYPALYANPGAVSGTFSTAQTAAATSSSKGVSFVAQRAVKYGVIQLDGISLKAADSKGAFASLVTTETDGVIEEQMNRMAFDLYRDGTGNRGQRASISGNIVTLATAADARNFEVGMTVIADDTATGLSPRTGSTTIAAVNLAAGTVTLANAASISSFTDNDYLFAAGDPTTVGTEGMGCMEGLDLLTPLTAPVYLSDSFRGVDRGVYPERLAGSRYDNVNQSIEQNSGLVAVNIDANGGMTNCEVLSPLNFYNLATRLNAKVEYEGAGGDVTWGFETIKISTAAGTMKVYSDPDCPSNRGRLFDDGSMYIKTLDDFIHVVRDDDGTPSMRVYNADSIELRTRSICNLIQSDTRNHGVFSI